MKKKVLLVHHTLQPPGGGGAVAAWTVEALRDDFELTVLTWGEVELEATNRIFGTSLRRDDCRWHSVHPALVRALDALPIPLALLTMHIVFRRVAGLRREEHFDAIVSTMNECDVGTRAIQYVHYPWARFPRPDSDYRWYHLESVLHAYRWGCAKVSGFRDANVRDNVTLVNSDWTGKVFEERYGAAALTVYPPVPGGFPDVPFERRDNSFVCVGRIAREKELEKLIEILAGVRKRGHDIGFHIVGQIGGRAYARKIRAAAAPHASWIRFHHDVPRDEMTSLMANSRYGIHGMVGEHFGIGPAELQRAGCITFVPDEGGPVEIVDRDERVTYGSVDDAVDKIDRILGDTEVRHSVLRDLQRRKDNFSENRFMEEIRSVVDAFVR